MQHQAQMGIALQYMGSEYLVSVEEEGKQGGFYGAAQCPGVFSGMHSRLTVWHA